MTTILSHREIDMSYLVIHDLNSEEWVSREYPGSRIVDAQGITHPCVGCFACWNRTPGRCVIKDGYDNMGSLIHHADEVIVISKYTYGGFSGPVKNVFDRCLGYVLPQFEVIDDETHHKKRYDEDKPFTFIFYGKTLTDEEKSSAGRYVQAVCTNIRGYVRDVIFRDDIPAVGKACAPASEPASSRSAVCRTILLNGSMRDGNSAKLARKLSERLGWRTELVDLRMHDLRDLSGIIGKLKTIETIVFCIPLYVDGLPSQVIRLMEAMEAYRGRPKRIYVLANMGLYESRQLVNLFSAVRQWCSVMGYEYCGGLGISAGELLGTLMDVIPLGVGPTRRAAEGMNKLAEAIRDGCAVSDIYAEPYLFPRSLYIRIANSSWNRTAKQNGISPGDLYRRL